MTSIELVGHSPLGASGAARWMKCPGSVGLSHGIVDPESDYAAEGTAAHALGAHCLMEPATDAWEYVGEIDTFTPGHPLITKEMADAVQVYLDDARSRKPDQRYIEAPFHRPNLHPYFWGTPDLTDVFLKDRLLDLTDYKHGAGIVVEVEGNAQTMYYGVGKIDELQLWDQIDNVRLRIVQPRGFHWDGPIREWTLSTKELAWWAQDVLIPSMDHALVSRETRSGEHCRFCPARMRACPQLIADMDELEKLMLELEGRTAPEITNEQVSRFKNLFQVAKILDKAQSEIAFGRLQAGQKIEGWKLANARSNRVWKPDAYDAIVAKFGGSAFTEPELKSPAVIDKMPEGTALTAKYAYKPDAGLTVVPDTDARRAVSKDTKAGFVPVKKGKK